MCPARASGKIDGVTFSSSSTVDFFKALFTPAQWRRVAPQVQGFCLGPITRRSMEAAGLSVAGEAGSATLDALVEKMVVAHGRA